MNEKRSARIALWRTEFTRGEKFSLGHCERCIKRESIFVNNSRIDMCICVMHNQLIKPR